MSVLTYLIAFLGFGFMGSVHPIISNEATLFVLSITTDERSDLSILRSVSIIGVYVSSLSSFGVATGRTFFLAADFSASLCSSSTVFLFFIPSSTSPIKWAIRWLKIFLLLS